MNQQPISTIIKNLILRICKLFCNAEYYTMMILLANPQIEYYKSLYTHLLVDMGKHEFSEKQYVCFRQVIVYSLPTDFFPLEVNSFVKGFCCLGLKLSKACNI